MSSYSFAQYAAATVGISFITKAGGRRACVFKRKAPFPATAKETEETTDKSFKFEFEISGGQGLLAIEVNGWSARPYRAPAVFLLGHPVPFSGNGDEAPYDFVAAPDPALVDRSVEFSYSPSGGGPAHDRPKLTWFDELGGSGEYIFTPESPGATICLRLPTGAKAVLKLGKSSPWGKTDISV